MDTVGKCFILKLGLANKHLHVCKQMMTYENLEYNTIFCNYEELTAKRRQVDTYKSQEHVSMYKI